MLTRLSVHCAEENRGDEQLQRIFEIELAMRARINFRKRLDQLGHAFADSHQSRAVEKTSRHFPRRALSTACLPRRKTWRAHANSLARITSPIGITIIAGPGKNQQRNPHQHDRAADDRDDNFSNLRRAIQPQRSRDFAHPFHFYAMRRSAGAQSFKCAGLFACESRELLLKLRRHVRHDHRVVVFVAQFEDVTDAMNLGDQRRFVRRNPKTRTQSP